MLAQWIPRARAPSCGGRRAAEVRRLRCRLRCRILHHDVRYRLFALFSRGNGFRALITASKQRATKMRAVIKLQKVTADSGQNEKALLNPARSAASLSMSAEFFSMGA